MTIGSSTDTSRPIGGRVPRRVALGTAFSLLFMAVLAAVAQFGVLKTLVVPADAAATTNNIAGSPGLFQAAIAAFLIVAILDVVVARGFFVLLHRVDEPLAHLVGWLRVVYAVVFAIALVNLVDAAQLVHGAAAPTLASEPLQAQVANAVASFDTTWHLALGIFGLHLVGLGALLLRFAAPRPLATLVVLAGLGYLADSIGTVFVAGYVPTISTFTFVGEALLIVWLFWRAARASADETVVAPATQTVAVAS